MKKVTHEKKGFKERENRAHLWRRVGQQIQNNILARKRMSYCCCCRFFFFFYYYYNYYNYYYFSASFGNCRMIECFSLRKLHYTSSLYHCWTSERIPLQQDAVVVGKLSNKQTDYLEVSKKRSVTKLPT
jgi:hypothetical protein